MKRPWSYPDGRYPRVGAGGIMAVMERKAGIERLRSDLAACEADRGAEHIDTIGTRHQLAHACRAAKRFDEALRLFERNADLCRQAFGSNHLITLRRRSSWANCYYAAGRYNEASALFRDILRDRERELGLNHPDTQRSRGSLANSCREAGREPGR